MYIPPLSSTRRAALRPIADTSVEQQALADLVATLAEIPTSSDPVVIVGDFNARLANRGPDLPEQPDRVSPDPVLSPRGRSLLPILATHSLLVLNGTTEDSRLVTSFQNTTAETATSVVDLALVSLPAFSLGASLSVDLPFPRLSDHASLLVSLDLPGLSEGPQAAGPPAVHPIWEPHGQDTWQELLRSEPYLAGLEVALASGSPTEQQAAIEALLLQACVELGLYRTSRPHNPNQDTKAHPAWFTLECRQAQCHWWRCKRTIGKFSAETLKARSTFRRVMR